MLRRCGNIFICLLVVAYTVGAYGAKLTRSDRSHRVIGGKSVEIKSRPYLVQLRTKDWGLFRCGATLVKPQWVITAAHCLDGINPKEDLIVVGNVTTIFDDGVESEIEECMIHPDYNKGVRYANDITVCRLKSALAGKYVQPVGMGFDPIPDEQFLTISGWGKTEEGVTGTVEPIRTARVAKIPDDECLEKYKNYRSLTPSMICAATPGKDACQGDSGGPAVFRGKLYAVVSWGKGCANPDYPGVYTSLSSVRDFLVKTKVLSAN